MTNSYNTVLYTGVTNDLQRRVIEHREGKGGKFTAKYRVSKLVFFEVSDDVEAAIFRENRSRVAHARRR